MWDDDLDIARSYIKQKRYQEAKQILLMMPGNLKAQEWLDRINRIQASQMQEFSYNRDPVVINQTIQQVNNNSNSGCYSEIPGCALALITLNMVVWGGLTVLTAFAFSPESGVMALFGVIMFFGISLLLSYLYWKFYWWMLALGWTFLTFVTLLVSVFAFQNANNFVP